MRYATEAHVIEGHAGHPLPRWPSSFLLLALGVLAGMTALVFLVVELPLLLGRNPAWSARIGPYAGILHVHAACGVLALFSGPLQFVPWVRQAHPALHRALGHAYLAAIAVAGPLAVWVAVFHADPQEGLAATVQGVLWMCTSATALMAVRRRDLATHRLWMARSYALTFTFVLHRYVIEILGLRLPADLGGTAAFIWLLTIGVIFVSDSIVAFYRPAKQPLTTAG
ncbi:DUF2306 domain-containing protein [Ramlibacter alkalitolerans]|uniref:DUF2306 domain-containing protein n=1 Tax=Ramlibacter alkalitolerans TaxID=2039631 RepID=A0ABS1JGZ5_9BURK|nr:DUF2306 domain-containing protein [Ramlibacter alkalitolerans]MBL0423503.1 DUF2306 domain-containing protein [Ramlibacter alkalitolerans]